MERVEAEAIYDAGREAVVDVLLAMDRRIEQLESHVARQDERIEKLERRLNRSSKLSATERRCSERATAAQQGLIWSTPGRAARP